MIQLPSQGSAGRGVIRLLNSTGGRVLCLGGVVDEEMVGAFRRRYGREPVRVDGIDARSVISLSPPALELVREHFEAAERAGRPVSIRSSPRMERLLHGAAGETGPVDEV